MPLWFIVTTAIVVIGTVAICNWFFRRIGQRLVGRLDGWDVWADEQKVECLKELKVETLLSQARTWRMVTILLVLVAYFVPASLLLLGRNQDKTAEVAEVAGSAAADAATAAAEAEHLAEAVGLQADLIQRGIDNSEYEACVNGNEFRLYNQAQKQLAIEQAQENLARAEATPAVSLIDLPGADAFPEFVAAIDRLLALNREQTIDQLEAEELRVSRDLAIYTEQFPLRRCGDDPIPTSTSTTTTSTTPSATTTTTSTSTSTSTTPTTLLIVPPIPRPATTVRPTPAPTTGAPTASPPTTSPPTIRTTTTTTLDCPGNSNNCDPSDCPGNSCRD